jgi:hypothetical protein
LQKDPGNDLLRGYLANSYTRLAQSLKERDAVAYYRRAVEVREALYLKSPGSRANRVALAECYANLARAVAADRPADGLKDYGKAIELLEGLTAADPKNAQYRLQLASAKKEAARVRRAD